MATRKRWRFEETTYLFKMLSKGLNYEDASELLNDKFGKNRTPEAIKTRVSKIRIDKQEYNKLKEIDDEWFESKNMKYVNMVLGLKTETQTNLQDKIIYQKLKGENEILKEENQTLWNENENLRILLKEYQLEEKLKEELSPELYEQVIEKLNKQ